MKTVLHKSSERGHANHGWLNSYHSFSFAGFYNPEKNHFGALRVLNDDTVKAGFGFSKHPHDNMEIISIPLSGDLEHNDSTGRHAIIKEGDVQIMSAGSGIAHSEMNANKNKEVKFLQIWIFPDKKNIEPRYEQKTFLPEDRSNQLKIVVAPDDASAIWINQSAWLSLGKLDEGFTTAYKIKQAGNGVYAFVLSGEFDINGQQLLARDAIGIWESDTIDITTKSSGEILLIDVPMNIKGVAQ